MASLPLAATVKNLKVGFIGAGKMATALAAGLADILPQGSKMITASCPANDAFLLDDIRAMGCGTTHSNKDLVANSDLVMLAVKPAVMPHVCREIRDLVTEDKIMVSMAAGVKLETLQKSLNQKARTIRVMPNTPSLVGEGATVYSLGNHCSAAFEGKVIETLFAGVGRVCHLVPESHIDAVTGISGSGPAYMYMIIEAMADAGVNQGLSRDLAYKLAAQTMVGAGRMVLDTGKHPAVLKDDVCSPAGSTIAALGALERNGVRNAMMQAVEAATNRCKQLGDS